MEVRTGRPVLFAQHTDRFIVENDNMDSDTEAESEMSLESRSILHRVNDQVRKMQNQSSKDATQDSNKTFFNMVSVYVFYSTSICIHGKELLRKFTLHQKYRDQSQNETDVRHICIIGDEIHGMETIYWENSSWKYLSLIGDEEVISLQRTRGYVFSDSVLCLGRMNENPQTNSACEDN